MEARRPGRPGNRSEAHSVRRPPKEAGLDQRTEAGEAARPGRAGPGPRPHSTIEGERALNFEV